MVYQVQKQHGRWLVEEKSDRGVFSCTSLGLSLDALQKITGGNSVVGALESRDSLVRYGETPALFHV